MEGVRVLPLCAYQIQSGYKFILLSWWTEIFRPFFIHAQTFLRAEYFTLFKKLHGYNR